MVHRALWITSLVVALAPLACVKSPAQKLDEQLEVMQQESDPELLIRRARAFASVGDHTRAEQYLQLALQSGASEERVLPLLVRACVADQRYRDAIAHLEQHLRRRPQNARARFLLASLHAAVGQLDAARRELERVLAALPAHADAHYALAVMLRDEVGNHSAADHHFREYLRLAPAGSHADEARGSLLQPLPAPEVP